MQESVATRAFDRITITAYWASKVRLENAISRHLCKHEFRGSLIHEPVAEPLRIAIPALHDFCDSVPDRRTRPLHVLLRQAVGGAHLERGRRLPVLRLIARAGANHDRQGLETCDEDPVGEALTRLVHAGLLGGFECDDGSPRRQCPAATTPDPPC